MNSFVFPGNIESDILGISSLPIPYMRTSSFSSLVQDCESMLLHLIGCSNGRVIFYTASGTGAMDAVVTNYVSLKNKAFVVAGGSFGYRWKSLCDYYDIDVVLYEVPFAKDIDYSDLEAKIALSHPDVFLCQQHETSTGQMFNLDKISYICKKYHISLVVDAISSFLADPLHMSDLGIDICITSSQKGLNIAPGLSFVILSQNISDMHFASSGYYFDFNENLKNLQRGQTPYSPVTTVFLQLHERLKRNIQIGVDSIISRVRERALFFRTLCNKYNWIVPAEVPSNCITGFFINRNGDILFKELLDREIYIMPGGTPNYFRVSHLGVQDKQDLLCLSKEIYRIEQL